ncbi:hypothetical protein HCJ66_01195 [Listeria sp. FSL L7-1582]|nr:hypothetical protein [Listeria portnoyi]MBC6308158.1 hypothetical protein [Listeria portnoyi]
MDKAVMIVCGLFGIVAVLFLALIVSLVFGIIQHKANQMVEESEREC